jgi:cytochrome P450
MIACQNEANFKNAQLYRPERWLSEDETKFETNTSHSEPGASLVLPFGIGKRSCPGKKFIEIWQTLLMGRVSVDHNWGVVNTF